MRELSFKRIQIMFVGLIMSAGMTMAADYTWITGGSDNKWTTAQNWQGGTGFPSVSGDRATFSAADTVNLNTNGVLKIGQLKVSASGPTTVTLNGDAGSALNFSGIGAPESGFRVDGHPDNRLIVNTDWFIDGRMDKMGVGIVEFTGNCTNTTNKSVYLGEGSCIFSSAATMNFPLASVGIGNGSEAIVILTNQATWNGKSIVFGTSVRSTTKGVLCQDSDDCSVTLTGALNLGSVYSAGSTNGYYYLRKGVLTTTFMTVGLSSPSWFQQSGGSFTTHYPLWVKNGQFLQTGGEAAINGFSVGNTELQPSVVLAGGHLQLNGDITTPGTPERQAFDFSGGVLQVDNSCSSEIPLRLSGTPTFDISVSGEAFTLAKGASGSSGLVKIGAGTLILADANQLSGNITISNGVVALGADSILESYGQSTEPLTMKICSSGVFRLTDINSVVTMPLALDIDTGGKIDFLHGGGSYNRSVLVARSIIKNGVALPPGRYTNGHGFIDAVNTAATVVIPIIWNGAGDGIAWSDAANWEGGVVPNGTSAVADLSEARQTVRLDNAVTLTCLVYNPQGKERALTLTGNGSLALYMGISYSAGMVVGPGRTLTLDLPLSRQLSDRVFTIVGGGTVVINKEFPSVNALSSPAFALYGDLVFAGQTTIADTLSMWRHEMNSTGSVIFTNGCNLSCNRILNGCTGFYAVRQILHDGGEVTCGDLFFTKHNYVDAAPYTYFMRSGSLTTTGANGICLGVFYTTPTEKTWIRYPGGSFVMSGGTVNATRFAMGMPGTVLDLRAGEVNLGSGGILATENNADGTVKLGGVTLRATANWSSTLNMTLTGAGGSTLIDTAGRTVTLSGALTGPGEFIKTGAGVLHLNGATNTFTSPLVVAGGGVVCGAASVFNGVSSIIVTNGTLELNGEIVSPGLSVRVGGTGSLILPAGYNLQVDRLWLEDTLRPAGTYTFGEGTVTVRTNTQFVWSGDAADGALWSTLSNWNNSVSIPDGADVVLDLGYSQFAIDDQIVLDVTPGVTLTNLVFDQGLFGHTLTITCPADTTNTLNFSANGIIRVEEGQTLVLDTDLLPAGDLYKDGLGTLVLNRRTWSDNAAAVYRLYIREGCVINRGAINALSVQPSNAALHLPPPEFVQEGDRAMMRDRVFALPGYYTGVNNGRGIWTQAGGTVDLSTLPDWVSNGGIGFMIAGGGGSDGTYNLIGGELLTCSALISYIAGNYANGTFNQSGGTSTFHNLTLSMNSSTSYTGYGEVNLSGGILYLAGTVLKGESFGSVNVSGGLVETLADGAVFALDVPVALSTGLSGDVTFTQASAAFVNTLPGTLSGAGGLRQAGPGTLALNGINLFGGSLGVSGGTLQVNTPLHNATDIYADGGHLELLATTPALTNLSVRAAGTTVRIVTGATPFNENLTLNLALSTVTDLDFTGIVEIDGLVLGGRAREPGLYGGVDSAAPEKASSVYFTGTGTLRVVNGPPPSGTIMLLR